MASHSDRISRLEALVGMPPDEGFADLISRSLEQQQQIQRLQQIVPAQRQGAGPSSLTEGQEVHSAILDDVRMSIRVLTEEVGALKRERARPPHAQPAHLPQICRPEPKSFRGARDAQELESFVRDAEEFFQAMKIPEAQRVQIASAFLAGDAKRWWRTRSAEDRRAGRPGITTWGAFQEELRIQFSSLSATWMARDRLRKLRQTGSIKDYVRAFSSLLNDIPDMSEADKVYHFQSGLQNWAQVELGRRQVQDLDSAKAVAESLADFQPTATPTPAFGSQKGKAKESRASRPEKGKRRAPVRKVKGPGPKPKEPSTSAERRSGCYLCSGAHQMRDCPMRGALLSAGTKWGEVSSSSEGSSRVCPQQALNALATKELSSCQELLFVKVRINGCELTAMVDTGATDNFLAEDIAREFPLQLATDATMLKAVNSMVARVTGRTEADLEVGPWRGPCSFTVIPIDDFKIILGMPFLKTAQVLIMPYLNGVLIGAEGRAGFIPAVPTIAQASSGMMAAAQPDPARDRAGAATGGRRPAQQTSDGRREGKKAYVAALRCQEPRSDGAEEVLAPLGEVTRRIGERKPDNQPKELLPRRARNHSTRREPSARQPAETPDRRMTERGKIAQRPALRSARTPGGCVPARRGPAGLATLRAHLGERPTARSVQQSRASGTRALFQQKRDDSWSIASNVLERHEEQQKMVCRRSREHHFDIKGKKCDIARTKVQFLGHNIDHGARPIHSAKDQTINGGPMSTTASKIRSFLGLAGQSRRVIEGRSAYVSPLTGVLREQRWSRPSIPEEAFDMLETVLNVGPVSQPLQHPDVWMDAADCGRDSVSVQEGHETAQGNAACAEPMCDGTGGSVRHLWMQDGLLQAQRSRRDAPKIILRRDPNHDLQWAIRTAIKPTFALLSRSINWQFEEILQRFVKMQRHWLGLWEAARSNDNDRALATYQGSAELQPRTPEEVASHCDGPYPAALAFAKGRTAKVTEARDSLSWAVMQTKLRAGEYLQPVKFLKREDPGRLRPAILPRFAEVITKLFADQGVGTSHEDQYQGYLVQWLRKLKSDATRRRVGEPFEFEDNLQTYVEACATRTSAPSGGGGLLPPP